jgi:hypothetical protein
MVVIRLLYNRSTVWVNGNGLVLALNRGRGHTVHKMDLILRCIQRRLQMQLSMARKFTLQPYRR